MWLVGVVTHRSATNNNLITLTIMKCLGQEIIEKPIIASGMTQIRSLFS